MIRAHPFWPESSQWVTRPCRPFVGVVGQIIAATVKLLKLSSVEV